MIRIVLADDQDLIRAGLGAIIGMQPDLEVVGEAGDGAQAARLAAARSADVVLMDVSMPGVDGIDGARAVASARPSARTLMLTTFDVDAHVIDALHAGASGYLLKTAPAAELLDAIRAVHEGRRIFAPAILERLVESFVRRPQPAEGVPPELAALTEREVEVFRELAHGRSNGEIAAALYLSEATVKTYVTRILGKLGLRDRVHAVILAYECGVVTLD